MIGLPLAFEIFEQLGVGDHVVVREIDRAGNVPLHVISDRVARVDDRR